MNRYKPVGWRNESYRHSLAAKGIRTSFGLREELDRHRRLEDQLEFMRKKSIELISDSARHKDKDGYLWMAIVDENENLSDQATEFAKEMGFTRPVFKLKEPHLPEWHPDYDAKKEGLADVRGRKSLWVKDMAKHSFLFKVEEDPSYKRLRINRGYKELVVVDAKKLKERFEKDHKTPLVWRQIRFDLLKDLNEFDKHPEVDVLSSGKIDFNDGRHRVAVAASKGETIEVAVRNKQKFIAVLGEQPPPFNP